MTPRIQLLHPSNPVGYPFRAPLSESRPAGSGSGNLVGYRTPGDASGYPLLGGRAAQRRGSGFGAEVIHLIDEMTLEDDIA